MNLKLSTLAAIVFAGIAMGVSLPAKAATFVFSDSVFNDQDWTVISRSSGTGGSVSVNHIGGTSSGYRQINQTVNRGSSSQNGSISSTHLWVGATYNPQT